MRKPALVQSVFDFAMREINALEKRIVESEDDADGMLWEQAEQVVGQLKAGLKQRELARQWVNVRTGEPYSQSHVVWTKRTFEQFTNQLPRPRFRDAYNEIANARQKKLTVHHSSETPEHYTPLEIIERVVACLGAIDLDPCSNPGDPNVPARVHFTPDDDGLAQKWHGRIYMNPPYGDEIDAWIEKLSAEYETGDVSEAIALIPGRIDTQWFKRLREYKCCFIEGRLTFIGNENPAPFPSIVVYLGTDFGKFYHHFKDIGDLWELMEPEMFGE